VFSKSACRLSSTFLKPLALLSDLNSNNPSQLPRPGRVMAGDVHCRVGANPTSFWRFRGQSKPPCRMSFHSQRTHRVDVGSAARRNRTRNNRYSGHSRYREQICDCIRGLNAI